MPDLLNDPFGWVLTGLLHLVFGLAERDAALHQLDALVAQLFAPDDPHNPLRLDTICGRCGAISTSLRPLGLLGLGVAVVARIVVVAVRSRHEGTSPVHLLADVGTRLICGVAALEGVFDALNWLSAQSMALAGGLLSTILRLTLHADGRPSLSALLLDGPQPLSATCATLATLLMALLVGYLTVMVVVSRAALVFTILAAPFSVPTLVWAEDSQLALLWLRMLLLALAVPPAAVLCLSLAVLLLMVTSAVPVLGGILPLLSLTAATWLSVKIVNGLTVATVRHARGGVGGTLRTAGLGPALRGASQGGGQARRIARPLRFGAGAALFGPGLRALARVPASGANIAFDTFLAERLLRAGISNAGGADLPERRREGLRTYYWARYLAQQVWAREPAEATA